MPEQNNPDQTKHLMAYDQMGTIHPDSSMGEDPSASTHLARGGVLSGELLSGTGSSLAFPEGSPAPLLQPVLSGQKFPEQPLCDEFSNLHFL